ncbi:MAG: OB-fold nucleic acid binding domain-containing protein [Candidatus Aureabacteria bacterium]|nr:OB-fold nucleic acid binding domain-containing protein [Candidatus Auribacterota bacterium]
MDEKKSAGSIADTVRDFPPETLCPSCGKFVGAYEKCPYCGTELKKRMSIIFFKRAALVLAIGGLGLLWFTATRMRPPLVRISDINARMNNAVVEVRGKVVGVSMMGKDGIGITVDDGSGDVRAQAFRGKAKMLELGNIPQVGDEVSLVGSIQMTDRYGTSLMLNLPSRVRVIPSIPEKVMIDQVTIANKNKVVEVVGEIIAVRKAKDTTILLIGDTTGTTDVPLFKGDLARVKDADTLIRIGNEIRISGYVDEFKGKPQVKVRNVEKIEVLSEDTIPTNKIPGYEKSKEKAAGAEVPAARREGGEGEAESQPSVWF